MATEWRYRWSVARYDCLDPEERAQGMREAAAAVRRGDLVVMPTDTVYGIGADAFSPLAIAALLRAKRRGRDMPPPVLVGTVGAAQALIEDLGPYGKDLIEEFWPGALTIICRANRTLSWDLGETKGTVAVRMPEHEVALELLKLTGPMAVSSANLTGNDSPTTATAAQAQLADAVEVYLDAGACPKGQASSIVDLTGSIPRLLRDGAIPPDRLREVGGALMTEEDEFIDATEIEARDADDAGPKTPAADEARENENADSGQGRDGARETFEQP